MNFPGTAWGALPLRFPAWIYRTIVQRNMRHKLRAARAASIPVISVGNLTVGGTGKTPLVGWIAEHLRRSGRRPAIVSRGYGGRAGRGPVVVSTGERPRVDASVAGDEPYFLATSLPGVIVVVGSDRRLGVERAAELGADVAILDDGFQHQQLARELDIVLIDGSDPFGNGFLLPAGPLREPLESLARADIVIVTRSAQGVPDEIEQRIRGYNAEVPVLAADHRIAGLFGADGRRVAPPQRALAFCGIGSPERFRHDLEATGVEVVEFLPYRDHHAFTMPELAEIARRAQRQEATIVTTEKDLARIGSTPHTAALLVLRIAFAPADAARLERVIADGISAGRP